MCSKNVGYRVGKNAGNNLRGFTLVELLVAVLIIGILAAVALPQYQKAVVKSRAAAILPVMDSLTQALNAFYMANGFYTNNGQDLDITPVNCTAVSDGKDSWQCGNDFLINIDAAYGTVSASYCPGYNNDGALCKAHREFQVGFGADHSTNPRTLAGARSCWVPNGAVGNGEAICKSLGTPVDCNDKTCYKL